jgi:hypothetical protein
MRADMLNKDWVLRHSVREMKDIARTIEEKELLKIRPEEYGRNSGIGTFSSVIAGSGALQIEQQ